MKSRTLLLATLAVVLTARASVLLGWYFQVPAAIFGEDRELQQAVDLMKGYLAQWGLPVPTQREEIIRSFFHY
ncbi:MAG: XkdW family protein [Gemmatales bacterium]|nr:XkdW family protein [Gemmatales bacterium]